MYTLGIPDRQKRRTLGYLRQKWIEFEESPSMDGFFDLRFPGMQEEAFRDIVTKLKHQGITIIGADEELTEKKIMKLTDLITEIPNLDESNDMKIISALKGMLQTWEQKEYTSDRDRWEEYFLDVQELVEDFEEHLALDVPAPSSLPKLSEEKVRKAIRKLIRQ